MVESGSGSFSIMKSGCATAGTNIHDTNVPGPGMADPAAHALPYLGDFDLGAEASEQLGERQAFHTPAGHAHGVQLKARNQIGKTLHTV